MTSEARVGPHIIAVGQFPPPVHGFAHITRCVVDRVKQDITVLELDITGARAASGVKKHVSRLLATISAVRIIGKKGSRADPPICYVACEGGLGLIYTWLVVRAARRVGMQVFLHHHSFAYIDSPSPYMRRVVAVNDATVHVFLCCTMRAKFAAVYGQGHDGRVLSNAAFVMPTRQSDADRQEKHSISIGLLSNLNREKGLYLFLDVLRAAAARNIAVYGVLAGPIGLKEDQAVVAQAQVELGDKLDYRGPLYGADKDRFYSDIDIFVFPTNYSNEAQPTVIFEALAAGCQIISYDRGCIRDQVESDGLVLDPQADFVAETIAWLMMKTSRLLPVKTDTIERYAVKFQQAQQVMDGLFSPVVAV